MYVWWNALDNSTVNQHCPNHSFTIIIHKSNRIKCWFLMTGENGSTRGKASQSRIREPTISLLDMWRQMRKLNPGHLGGRQLLSQYVVVVFLIKYCYRLVFFYCYGLLFVTCSIAGRTWSALGFAIRRVASFQKGNFAYGKPNMTIPLHVWLVSSDS